MIDYPKSVRIVIQAFLQSRNFKKGVHDLVVAVVTGAVVCTVVTFPEGVVGFCVWVAVAFTPVCVVVGTVVVGGFKSTRNSTIPFGVVVLPLLIRAPFL